MPEEPPLTITDLATFRKQLKKQEQLLKEKRAKVEAFQGLPPVSSIICRCIFSAQLCSRYVYRILSSPGMLYNRRETNKWGSFS